MLAGRLTGHGGLSSQEAEDEPVLVGRPDLSVEAQEAGTSGFSPPNPIEPRSDRHEPLKLNWYFDELA